jgi:outer membrane protein assembly factor BamB
MVKTFGVLGLFVLALLTACGSNDSADDVSAPAPLAKIDEEKEFDRVWSEGIGDGQGEIYNRISPAIDGEVIYVAAANGDVEAFTLDEGDDVWSTDLDTELVGGVGVGGGMVFVGGVDGELIALDQASGELRWQAKTKGEVVAPAQVGQGYVFVQTLSGRLLALKLEDGSEHWVYNASVPVLTLRGTSTPVVFRDQVIAGFANGRVTAFDIESGGINWDARVAIAQGGTEIERIVDVDGELLLNNTALYAVSYQGQLVSISPDNGGLRWAEEVSSHVGMSEGFGNVYVVTDKGNVEAYSNNGQGLRWKQEALKNRRLSGVVTLGSYVIVGDKEGYIHALSQVDGRIVAREKVDGDGVQSRLLVHKQILYVYGNGGKLAAYRLEDD